VSEELATSMRTGLCGRLGLDDVGRRVRLCGWVARRREHGEHLAFVDLRDYSGVVQCVVDRAVEVRGEDVVAVEGIVRRRPEGTANPRLATGEVEIAECRIERLAAAQTPPLSPEDRVEPDEALRMRYRYLDLRRPRLQRNLRLRAQVSSALRSAIERHGFCEVETPLLWAPTPEGAREFAVPSRLHHGSFYVLPQSPQLAKQLLMVAGFDRYYQIARCLRDEDPRADRQYEFTQFDLEASFVSQEDVMAIVGDVVRAAAQAVLGEPPGPIETMTYDEAMSRFGTDKPDLRFGMELVDLGPALTGTGLRALAAPQRRAITVPGGGQTSRSRLDGLVDRARQLGAPGLAWFRVQAGETGPILESPLAGHLSDQERAALLAATGAEPGDLVLAVAGEEWRSVCTVLGALRVDLGGQEPGPRPSRFVWVVDFPMFEGLDETGRPVPAHHPFTMPHPEDLDRLATDPLSVRAQAYDLVLNGWELGSGSVRIHRPDVQRSVFAALGISEAEARGRFGFLLDALAYGAPPHAGFAFGLDRLVAIFCGEENIREVIAFPKTQSGADLMTGAPKPLSDAALAELGLAPPAR